MARIRKWKGVYSAPLGCAFLFGMVSLFLLAGPGRGAPEGVDAALSSFEDMAARYREIRDYRCVLIKQEWLHNRMDQQKMILLFRKPMDIKLTWITPNSGQQAVYRVQKSKNRFRARKGGWLGFFTVDMDINDKRALETSRYPITCAGIGAVLEKTMQDIGLGQCEVRTLGEENVDGQPCLHLEFHSLGPKNFHQSLRTEFWVDKKSGLPIQLKMMDYEQRMIGCYTFSQLELNVGLTDKDFEL